MYLLPQVDQKLSSQIYLQPGVSREGNGQADPVAEVQEVSKMMMGVMRCNIENKDLSAC